jgi:beta-glucosidase
MGFPRGFIWGVATASYQIEGATDEEGKGPSVWDMFCRKQGAIWQGQSGDVACDHYHRHQADISLMKQLGIGAYRFSISWPRVIPDGTGRVNKKGLEFYDRLVDEILAAGIIPYVTLFHWDYPYELYSRGGWLNRDSPDWFADYVRVVVKKLSDRVRHWITLNEPQVFIGYGHQDGRFAPGLQLRFSEVLAATHNTLLAHGKAAQAIRSYSKTKCQIGLAPVGVISMPASDSPKDIKSARQHMFSITSKDVWNNTWWLDPMFFGQYPKDGLKLFGGDIPLIRDRDMETIHQPLDFFGLNIYLGQTVRANEEGQAEVVPEVDGYPITAFEWPVTPEALYWGPKYHWERYHIPIIITENGMSNVDWVALDGKVHDPQRIDFLKRYLLQLRKACEDGIDVRGYFHWSLMDNFEWSSGYRERFGLIYVDFPTQKRIPKDSAYWYRETITNNGNADNKGKS